MIRRREFTTLIMFGSTRAGPPPTSTAAVDMRRNWSRLRPTLSWPPTPRSWERCNRRRAAWMSSGMHLSRTPFDQRGFQIDRQYSNSVCQNTIRDTSAASTSVANII
jgi:hypothetical protein